MRALKAYEDYTLEARKRENLYLLQLRAIFVKFEQLVEPHDASALESD